MNRKNVMFVFTLIVLAAFAVPAFAGGTKDGSGASADLALKGLIASVEVVSKGGAGGRVLTEFVKLTKDDLDGELAKETFEPAALYAVKFTLFGTDGKTEVTSTGDQLEVVVKYALSGEAKSSKELKHGIWVGLGKSDGGKGTDWVQVVPGKSGAKGRSNSRLRELAVEVKDGEGSEKGFVLLTFKSWPKGDPLIWGD